MTSFITYDSNSDFSIHNIPFGVAVFNKEYIACATRIGDMVVDLASLYDYGFFDDIAGLNENIFEAYTLNEFIELGKPVNPNLHVGICGEHGGDPSSVEFCDSIGLDYVSCSPFRVPIARLAAAQAAIAKAGK